MTHPPRGRRRLPRLALGAVAFVLGVALVLLAFGGEEDISNPDVAFVETTESPPSTAGAPIGGGRHPSDDGFEWPVYGFTKARTHHLPLSVTPRPPYREAWAVRGSVLLEFTPVLCGRKLYLLRNDGTLYGISRATGHVSWRRKLGSLAAASPACSHGTVYAVLLQRERGSRGGRVVAVSAHSGRTRWSRRLPSRAESSPLLDREELFIGTEDGTVYALNARSGAIRWRARAAGAVKGAIALDAGKLYFGDYAGKVYALRRSNGNIVWTASGGGSRFGGDGNFYSSPAVHYGRVYIGSTNGNVYSFSSADGQLAWRRSTGDYVYASPAVGRVPGGSPTVYIGSYDGRFYALDARSGRTRWVRSLGRKISGAATIVGDLVFVSDLDKRTTWALGARTGQTAWKTGRGAFNPAISDGRRVYFSGYSSLFALDPAGRPFVRSASARLRQERARALAARVVAAQAALAAARSRRVRQLRFRKGLHGHRHPARRGGPPRCHLHRHVYRVDGRRLVLKHTHCHRHVRRRG